MTILTIRHVTSYHYRQPVGFGEHRIMMLPRDDGDQAVIESALEIWPQPSQLNWTCDSHGNHVATARFAQRASVLQFESTIRVDHISTGFDTGAIDEHARHTPFSYSRDEWQIVAPFLMAQPAPPSVAAWAAAFLDGDGCADTGDLITAMTQKIFRDFRHKARHEKGVQDAAQSLHLKSGSCRDVAVLMIAALRSLSIAARFVSGYLHLANDDPDRFSGGNTHAWLQAYIPGPGWIDIDPSTGIVGNDNLIRVAVVRDPVEAIPLQGSWIGVAADHLAMKVAVKVTADGPARKIRLRT